MNMMISYQELVRTFLNSLAIKFVTDFVLASKNPSDIPGFKLKQLFIPYVDELTE